MKREVFVATIFATMVFAACNDRYCPASDFVVTVTDDGTAVEITGYVGGNTAVRIPPTIQGLPVTAIDFMAFVNSQLTGISIPDSVTRIGAGAFMVNQLTALTVPYGVTHIGIGAFMINQLTNVDIPDSVTHIGGRAFWDNELTDVSVAGHTQVQADAFDPGVTVTRR